MYLPIAGPTQSLLLVYILFPGYTAVMPWQGIPLEEAMPVTEPGDIFTVDDIKLVEKQTSPPDYLTEAELITLMEKHGIGIPQHCLLDITVLCIF